MITRLRNTAAASALLAAFALAACGGDGGSPEATGTAAATIPIAATEYEFDPAEPTVQETGVIEFEISNEGEVEHNLEIETPQGEFELEENVPPGETATLEAEIQEPGEYTIYCPVGDHRQRGMEGTLTVAGGGGGGGTDQDPEEGGGSGGGY